MMSDGNTPLHSAISNFEGDARPVKILLEQDDSDINVGNFEGETPLHLAVKNRRCSVELINLLLEHGADVKAATPRDGNTALHLAIITSNHENISIPTILLEHGGSDVNARNLEGYIPLHLAVQKEDLLYCRLYMLVDALLHRGSDVNVTDFKQRNTPLHLYLQNKLCPIHCSLKRDFLDKMRDVNVVNSKGETLLHLFVRHEMCDMITPLETMLSCGLDASKKDAMGENAVQAYCRAASNDRRVVNPQLQILLRSSEEQLKNSSPLHVACLFHRHDSVLELLKLGADVNAIDTFGYPPLAYALISYREQLWQEPDKYFTLKLMLDHGADITRQIVTCEKLLYSSPIDNTERGGLTSRSILEIGNNRGDCRAPNQRYTYSGDQIFIRHLVKLLKLEEKQIERGINVETSYQWTFENMLSQQRGCRPISSDMVDNSWFSRCSEELEEMSESKVGESSITFLDLLLASAGEMAIYAKNKELAKAFRSNKTCAFPMYQGMLDAKLARNIERREFIERAAVLLSDALEFAEPRDEFFERTLSYCSNRDLISIIDGLDEKMVHE